MASKLHDKINSFPIERGYELNESVTVNPAKTGTSTATGSLILNAAGTGLFYEPNDGPVGGAGSWKTAWTNSGTTNGRFILPSTEVNPLSNDLDYGFGFWFKLNSIPTSIAGFLASYGNSSSAGVICSWRADTKKIRISTAGGLTNTDSVTAINDTNWHYIAVRREISPSIKYYLYVDGVLQASPSATSVTPPTGGQNYGSASAQTVPTFYISYSNIHWASSAVLNENAISEIWLAGSTPPSARTVKYYDGSSWQTSSAQKIFNGTNWIDWNAKHYDGTNWVVV